MATFGAAFSLLSVLLYNLAVIVVEAVKKWKTRKNAVTAYVNGLFFIVDLLLLFCARIVCNFVDFRFCRF